MAVEQLRDDQGRFSSYGGGLKAWASRPDPSARAAEHQTAYTVRSAEHQRLLHEHKTAQADMAEGMRLSAQEARRLAEEAKEHARSHAKAGNSEVADTYRTFTRSLNSSAKTADKLADEHAGMHEKLLSIGNDDKALDRYSVTRDRLEERAPKVHSVAEDYHSFHADPLAPMGPLTEKAQAATDAYEQSPARSMWRKAAVRINATYGNEGPGTGIDRIEDRIAEARDASNRASRALKTWVRAKNRTPPMR